MSTSDKQQLSDTRGEDGVEGLPSLKLRKARLVCINPDVLADGCGHVMIPVGSSPLTIGRSRSNDVVLNASGVSRNHLRLNYRHTGWEVEDAGSSNGIEINKSTVEKQTLNEGDIVSLGTVHYKFSLESGNGLVEDAERQVSLFDVEKTLVVSRQDLDLDSLPGRKPVRTAPAPKRSSSKRWIIGVAGLLLVVGLSVVVFS